MKIDEINNELKETLAAEFPNETKEHLDRLLTDFVYDYTENDYDFSLNEVKWSLIDFAKEWLLTQSADSNDEIQNQNEGMTVQETVFCETYLKTYNPSAAYAASHTNATDNPDSVRSLASRFMRRPKVAAFIQSALEQTSKSAFEFGIWSRNQSLLARKQMLVALKTDIELRQKRLQSVIESIQNDETLSAADKAQRIVQATQKPILGRDTIEAFNTLCNGLDALTWTYDYSKTSWFTIDGEQYNTWEREHSMNETKKTGNDLLKSLGF